ncbi:MAG: alpha/beta hydrolase fold protein [Frankiales bacterium]|nr:alpha/beta hydrolase fold protein [Frankiales bacterium]
MPYVARDGNEIWWESTGSGPETVLLVMGHAWDARMWHRVARALEPSYRVVVFDNRGVGRTHWDGKPFFIEDLAQDALAALDAAGVERAHVYGASMGGLTAQEIALRAPERVLSLVLGCTGTLSPDLPMPEQPKRRPLKSRIPRRVQLLLMPKLMYGTGTPRTAIREDMTILRDTKTDRDGLLAQGVAVAHYRSRERLAGLDVPTLVIHGDADKIVAHAMGVELASLIPGARFETLPGEGHVYMTAVDGRANKVLLDFLATQPR